MRALIIAAILCLVTSSCSENELNDGNSFIDNKTIQTVNGTWKLISFEDLMTDKVEFKSETNSWGRDIIITFDDTINPHNVSGINTTNSIKGEFEYISYRHINVQNLYTTKVGQPDWGNKFVDAILSGNLDFKISNDQLRVYYNNKMSSMTFDKQ
jgi:hypothetical protein